jgi:hypothetical protein
LQYLGQSIAQAGQQFAQIPILREQANRQRIQDERDTLKFGKEMEAADLNTQYIKTNMAATQASTQAAQEKAAQGQRNLSGEADLSAALQGDPEAGARLVQLVVAEMQKAGFQINPPTTREQAGLKGPSAQALEGMGMEQAPPQAPAGLNPQLRPQASTPMVGMGSQSPMAERRQQLGQEALEEMGSMQYQGMGDMEPGAKYTSLSNRFSGSQSPVVEKAIDRAQEDTQSADAANRAADAAARGAVGRDANNARLAGDSFVRAGDKVLKAAAGDPLIRAWRTANEAMLNARVQLEEGNPIADSSARFAVAKAIQGGGVLTDQDIKQLGGSTELKNRVAKAYERAATGKMTGIDRNYMLNLTGLIIERTNGRIEGALSKYAEAAPATYGVDQTRAKAILAPLLADTPATAGAAADPQPQNETPEQRRERLRLKYVK